MNILTSKHSKESAIALGEALNVPVYNVYQREFYRGNSFEEGPNYNMGCTSPSFRNVINSPEHVAICINKIKTLDLLKANGVLTVPYTRNIHTAQEWLDSDRIVVNRTTIIGKANEGLHYSYKGLDWAEDKPLREDAVIWTRYVNHIRELRAYVFKGQAPLLFEKVVEDDKWVFKKIRPSEKLLEQVSKAQQAFSGLIFSAFDVLECVTGDFYTIENNSAPSLLMHDKIIPTLKRTIDGLERGV